jgi:amphi-Trp domain-containing protein
MPEEVIFESEATMDRAEIAGYLRQVADSLDAGEPITLSAGDQSTTLEPSARPEFEVKVEREGPTGGPKELSVEFEIEWPEDGGDGGSLSIG